MDQCPARVLVATTPRAWRESATNRRERHQRGQARVLLRLGKVAGLLSSHHSAQRPPQGEQLVMQNGLPTVLEGMREPQFDAIKSSNEKSNNLCKTAAAIPRVDANTPPRVAEPTTAKGRSEDKGTSAQQQNKAADKPKQCTDAEEPEGKKYDTWSYTPSYKQQDRLKPTVAIQVAVGAQHHRQQKKIRKQPPS